MCPVVQLYNTHGMLLAIFILHCKNDIPTATGFAELENRAHLVKHKRLLYAVGNPFHAGDIFIQISQCTTLIIMSKISSQFYCKIVNHGTSLLSGLRTVPEWTGSF